MAVKHKANSTSGVQEAVKRPRIEQEEQTESTGEESGDESDSCDCTLDCYQRLILCDEHFDEAELDEEIGSILEYHKVPLPKVQFLESILNALWDNGIDVEDDLR